MRIKFQREKTRRVSGELLTLSRTVRQTGYEVEDILRELRLDTEFEECVRSLTREMDAMSLLTAQIVNLSVALNDIGELYALAEARNREKLESSAGFRRASVSTALYLSGGDTRTRLERILCP